MVDHGWKGYEGQLVTILSRDEIGKLLGLRGPALRRRLQELRDEGRLICDEGRLTKRVRYADPGARYGRVHRREFVLRARAADLSRVPNPHRGRWRVLLI